jgi:hypothetical protein
MLEVPNVADAHRENIGLRTKKPAKKNVVFITGIIEKKNALDERNIIRNIEKKKFSVLR